MPPLPSSPGFDTHDQARRIFTSYLGYTFYAVTGIALIYWLSLVVRFFHGRRAVEVSEAPGAAAAREAVAVPEADVGSADPFGLPEAGSPAEEAMQAGRRWSLPCPWRPYPSRRWSLPCPRRPYPSRRWSLPRPWRPYPSRRVEPATPVAPVSIAPVEPATPAAPVSIAPLEPALPRGARARRGDRDGGNRFRAGRCAGDRTGDRAGSGGGGNGCRWGDAGGGYRRRGGRTRRAGGADPRRWRRSHDAGHGRSRLREALGGSPPSSTGRGRSRRGAQEPRGRRALGGGPGRPSGPGWPEHGGAPAVWPPRARGVLEGEEAEPDWQRIDLRDTFDVPSRCARRHAPRANHRGPSPRRRRRRRPPSVRGCDGFGSWATPSKPPPATPGASGMSGSRSRHTKAGIASVASNTVPARRRPRQVARHPGAIRWIWTSPAASSLRKAGSSKPLPGPPHGSRIRISIHPASAETSCPRGRRGAGAVVVT